MKNVIHKKAQSSKPPPPQKKAISTNLCDLKYLKRMTIKMLNIKYGTTKKQSTQ